MYLRWNDFDRTLSVMEDLRRRMDAAFNARDQGREQAGLIGYGGGAQWPNVSLWDAGQSLVLTADVPGMGEKDVAMPLNKITVTRDETNAIKLTVQASRAELDKAPAFDKTLFMVKTPAPETTTGGTGTGGTGTGGTGGTGGSGG